jgi:primosomal protein N' (replication factor Y)
MALPLNPTRLVVDVLVPMPVNRPYTYLILEGAVLQRGDMVSVSVQKRTVIGVVWAEPYPLDPQPQTLRLKTVEHTFEGVRLPEISLEFMKWVAAYTLTPLGTILRMVISLRKTLEPIAPQVVYGMSSCDVLQKPSTARQKVIALFEADPQLKSRQELIHRAGVTSAVVKKMIEMGQLIAHEKSTIDSLWKFETIPLSADQTAAAHHICETLHQSEFHTMLLDGVTGSGKTEVYFEAIAEACKQGKQVLVLLPEIALSAQWLSRFTQRFNVKPEVWHSEISPAKRQKLWHAVLTGQARVVVGARSALFLPYANLGLIVVDEEHEASFKQEKGVIYNARDMAVARAHLGQIPIVLVTATPSLETLMNCESGRYERLHLPDRHGGALLPQIEVIDMRQIQRQRSEPQTWLSPQLRKAIAETTARREQAMLYLNRRGYAPLTLCRSCGERLACPSCTSWLVMHRHNERLMCHHCGHTVSFPQQCPKCEAPDTLVPCGPGIERLYEEVKILFPHLSVEMMASDTMTSSQKINMVIEAMHAGQIDILIGTQMMAKGYHFPGLTLVGVVDADLGLSGGDLRASERTYQLLHQVAGRAGRAEQPGQVMLQTYMPEHPVLAALVSGDRDQFLELESSNRKALNLPPYGRLAALIVSGTEMTLVEKIARTLARHAPRGEGIEVFGPAPAALARVRGRYRWRLLLKTTRNHRIQSIISAWLASFKIPSTARVQVDIDPYSFW